MNDSKRKKLEARFGSADESLYDLVIESLIMSLSQGDFAFAIELDGVLWDVYRFGIGTPRGTIAFALDDDDLPVVGIFTMEDEMTEQECRALLQMKSMS